MDEVSAALLDFNIAITAAANGDRYKISERNEARKKLVNLLERLAGYQGQRVWMVDEQMAHRRVSGDFNLDRAGESLQSLAAAQHLQLQGVLGHWLVVH